MTGKGIFTITEVRTCWGKLKSGAGWIYLGDPDYTTILGSGTAQEPTTPQEVEQLAQEISAMLKASSCDPGSVLKRVGEILA